ncbi:MAG TPA: MEDS domain-containing protein [Bryobacteraceae bacterium]|nr:MEDS domain-containing protein [Bryobacteraceae bacterium]
MPAESPIHLAGTRLEMPRHVCAFFHNADEEYEVLLPFLSEGIHNAEKAFHIVDPQLRSEHAGRLESAGIDVAACEASGQLEVRVWEEAYLRGGHFDQNAMLSLIEEVLQNGYAQGYTRTRLLAHMEWALQDRPGVDDLLEYETRLNYILPKYRDPVV